MEEDPGAIDDEHVESLHQNRARASSFGANAELYDRTRPRYPAAFLDALVAAGATHALDVGCGTGILGGGLLARGVEVLGVEPDDQMAVIAERVGLSVERSTFEEWDDKGRHFELLVSGQAWHWVEPTQGARKAEAVVDPGGTVAHAWNVGSIDGPIHRALDDVYQRLTPGKAQPLVPHRRSDGHQTASEAAFVATGAFDGPEQLVYPWTQRYTTAEWLAQLETHSDHHLLSDSDRAELLAAVGDVIDADGGSFIVSYDCEVTRFTRR
jgi:SAM-dependent methyltransferase